MRALPVLAVLLGAALSAQSAPTRPESSQGTPGVFRTGATAVVLDVVVRDGRNRPVVNLGPDDFEIYEDGVKQTLGSFRTPAAAMPSAAALPGAAAPRGVPPAAAAAAPVPREASVVAFVFDRLTAGGRHLALDAVRRYVGDAAQTPNIVGVFDIPFVMLQPFTQDGEAIRESLDRVRATGRSSTSDITDMPSLLQRGPPGARPLTTDLTISVGDLFMQLERAYTAGDTIDGLGAVVAGLGRAPGRKSIVLFSDGFGVTRDTDVDLHTLIDQANRANVAMYTVDTAGLRARSHTFLAGRYAAQASQEPGADAAGSSVSEIVRAGPNVALGMLANATGGQLVENTNDVFKAFPRLDEDLRSYYELTYAPPRAQPDGKFHKIAVKVKRPGLSAKTRSGYTALPVGAGELPVLAFEAPALARLESSPLPNELPVLAKAFVFPVSHERARVPVMVSMASGALDYTRDEAAGTFTAEAVVLVRIRDAQGQMVHKASEQYTVSGKLENLDASRSREMLFYRQPQLAPGVYSLEAIVQDSHTGKAGVRISSLEVPRATESLLRMGTPFIVQRAERVPAAERDTSNPLYFGDLLLYPNLGQPLSKANDSVLMFAFTAYDDRGVRVEASIDLVRSGRVVATVPISLANADGDGRINQLSRLPLDALAPGAYELRVTVKSGDQEVTRGVRFAIAVN